MNALPSIKLVATDLDGTLLNDERRISKHDLRALERLGKKSVMRVAATGRSMHKVKEVLSPVMPFDYIVFSSGSGIYDWTKREICTHEDFERKTIEEICEFMTDHSLNFFVFQPIPHNNLFWYQQGEKPCIEFRSYVRRHKGNCKPLDTIPESAGQIMCILPNDEALFNHLKLEIETLYEGVRVIRTTSPINGRFIWLEVFPNTVSKGHGIQWICQQHGIHTEETACLGNDFNDLEMLHYVAHAYLTFNAPSVLKEQFRFLKESNNESAFSAMVKLLFSNELT